MLNKEADALIQRSQAKAYAEAVQLLKNLRNLAKYQSRQSVFEEHQGQICDRYNRRRALTPHQRAAGLIE